MSVTLDWDAYRRGFDLASDHKQDWQGMPVFLPDMPVTLQDRHPLASAYREMDAMSGESSHRSCSTNDVDEGDEVIVNHWRSRARHADVYVARKASTGRASVITVPIPPDGAMNRLTYWLSTLVASDAWDLDAEAKAMEKLAGMITERQMRHYLLTGSFLERSPRSDLHYVFRRSRPTIVLSERWWSWKESGPKKRESMRCLAVLCLHPIGFYSRSWAGCMVPTDDVIAHLCMCRGDEASFWRIANQHNPADAEAGL